uniref:Putative secreted peptide n=1 Tax=Anopheles braziliensis TaxID=58242 RepID=A0A2M3ZMU9_9DIPT
MIIITFIFLFSFVYRAVTKVVDDFSFRFPLLRFSNCYTLPVFLFHLRYLLNPWSLPVYTVLIPYCSCRSCLLATTITAAAAAVAATETLFCRFCWSPCL